MVHKVPKYTYIIVQTCITHRLIRVGGMCKVVKVLKYADTLDRTEIAPGKKNSSNMRSINLK